MDTKSALEYPLPVLSVSVKELSIEAGGERDTVAFSVRNSGGTGGGTLQGRIIPPAPCIRFEPEQWESNRQEIKCIFSPLPEEGWKPGDVRSFSAKLLTNGGEAELPITVRMAKMAITTEDGYTLANLQDFFAYAEQFPDKAAELFEDGEFHTLLVAMDFAYTDVYNLLKKEENRARALDNFFILAGLKKHTALRVTEPSEEHRSLENAMLHSSFLVEKSDKGYVEAAITTENNALWLTLAENRLTTADFDSRNLAEIKYSVDPLHIKSRYVTEKVIISINGQPQTTFDISFKRPEPLLAYLPREGFKYKDEGFIMVESQTKEPQNVEITCNEPFVRFFQRQYKVNGQLQIPFIIKLPPLQAAQMLFRKIPSLSADIVVRSGKVKKVLRLTAGEW